MGLSVERSQPGDKLGQGDPENLAEFVHLNKIECPLSRLVFADEGLRPGQPARNLALPDAPLQA